MTDAPFLWYCPLPELACLTLSGQDAAQLLHGQTTCDVLGLPQMHSTLGALCSPQGRTLAIFRVFHDGSRLYLLLPAERADAIARRLRLYVLRSDVHIEDTTAHWRGFGVGGAGLEQAAQRLGFEVPTVTGMVVPLAKGGYCLRVPDDGHPRLLCLVPADLADTWLARLTPANFVAYPPSHWELAEIRAGLPEVLDATAEVFVPQMLNLDRLDAISFTKGCYTGQEVVARTHYLGTVKRRLYRLQTPIEEPPKPGTAIFRLEDEQSIGQVIRAARNERDGSELLAVLNTQAAKEGSLHLGSPGGTILERLPLPYSPENPS